MQPTGLLAKLIGALRSYFLSSHSFFLSREAHVRNRIIPFAKPRCSLFLSLSLSQLVIAATCSSQQQPRTGSAALFHNPQMVLCYMIVSATHSWRNTAFTVHEWCHMHIFSNAQLAQPPPQCLVVPLAPSTERKWCSSLVSALHSWCRICFHSSRLVWLAVSALHSWCRICFHSSRLV